jgi:hypothetical protein
LSHKFVALEVGQRFLYEGAEYIKSSPLKGRNTATGQERLMARSSIVQVDAGGAPRVAPKPAQTLPADDVVRALDRFAERCRVAIGTLGDETREEVKERLRQAILAARRECEETLRLSNTSG